MMHRVTFGFFLVLVLVACDSQSPVDVLSIKDAENREFFKELLVKEEIPFQLAVEHGQEVMKFERKYSKAVQALIDEYGGLSLEPERAVCYKDQRALDLEINKLKSANARFSIVRSYAYKCISWDKKDSDLVKRILY